MDSVAEYRWNLVRANPSYLLFQNLSSNSAVIDMTSATLKLVAKWSPDDADGSAVFTLTTGGGGITTTATDVTCYISRTRTSTLPYRPTILYYELCWLNGSSEYQTLVRGKLFFEPNVNRT